MLHTEPSFSVYADEDVLVDNKTGDLKVEEGSSELIFAKTMGVSMENDEDGNGGFSGFEPVGIHGGELKQISFDESGDAEENYKRIVDEDPSISNPVFLKNHAHLLQANGDLNGAEEYYFRATRADPNDGETLMQYAKLVWELHRHKDRALAYFESAVHAAPQDCDVLAAYASFLWEIDEDEENDEANTLVEESLEVEEKAGIFGAYVGLGSNSDLEEYYKRMVHKNCRDPLLLSNYARFLQQTKGDLEEAKEYYSRAVQADPGDGQVISQYAQLVWELHCDQHKASGYFKRAVEAAPANSYVLAAYAKFLWEAEDDDDDELRLPILQESVTSKEV